MPEEKTRQAFEVLCELAIEDTLREIEEVERMGGITVELPISTVRAMMVGVERYRARSEKFQKNLDLLRRAGDE